jgi:hypothetical protein
MAVCLFQGATSPQFTCHSGVPQGSVLSPHLFNFFLYDFPAPTQLNFFYADNINLSKSCPDVPFLGQKLTDHLTQVSQLSKDNKLLIAPEKSVVTLFTPNTRETNVDPGVFYKGAPIPVDRKPKWLGFTISNLRSATPHLDNTVDKGNTRIQIMKAIKGQD